MSRVFDDANSEYLSAAFGHLDEGITMTGWFKFDASPDAEQAILALNDASSSDGHYLKVDTTVALGDRVVAYTRGASLKADTHGSPSQDTWHFGVGRYVTNTSREAGMDGAMSGTPETTDLTVDDIDMIAIGAIRPTGGDDDFFSGRLMWTPVWSHPSGTGLSNDSITRLANGVEPVFVERNALKFFARLMGDEDVDQIGGLALTPNTVMATSAASWAGDVLTLTIGAHSFVVGDSVTTGAFAEIPNATRTLTAVDSTTISMALTPDPTIVDEVGTVTGARLENGPSSDNPAVMVRALPRGRGRDRHRFT